MGVRTHLGQVGREHLSKEVTLKLSPEGPEGISQAKMWEIIPGRGSEEGKRLMATPVGVWV